MTTKEDFWSRKEKLNGDFLVTGSAHKPATSGQIAQYEEQTGFTFSEDIRDFLLTFGSLVIEVREEVWKRPVPNEILSSWKFGYGFFVYGLSQDEEMPPWMSYAEKYKETLNYTDVPKGQMFFKRTGNLYRAYTGNGVITIEYGPYGSSDTDIFEGNIYDFLISEIDMLESDYEMYINERQE